VDRRTFLKTLGRSTVGLSGVLLGGSAFEYALQGQELIQKREFDKAVQVLSRAAGMDPSSDWIFGLPGSLPWRMQC